MAAFSTCMITVEGLTKRYGKKAAVDGVSFSVAESEIFGLLGPNGAGKTTTMSLLSTLMTPDEGRVTLCGLDPSRNVLEAKRLIGYVPQELALYPSLSAWDNLVFFARIYGLRGDEIKRNVYAALETVGLTNRIKEPIERFSGGMKRRLNIAAGLIHRPRILFLDEPTVGIDPQSRNFILEHIERLRSEGMTIVYTTHYMEEATRLCDHVAVMDHGRILALDTQEGLLQLLGGGVLLVGLEGGPADFDRWKSMQQVQRVTPIDGRIKLEVRDTRAALLELIDFCSRYDCSIQSLEVLEPNLESVFMHLTGRRLRN